MAAPKHIQEKAIQLNKALCRVAKLADEVSDWAENHGADLDDFWYENRLDNPYEFNLADLLDALDELASN